MDLMDQIAKALGGQSPMLLPQRHPLPAAVARQLADYLARGKDLNELHATHLAAMKAIQSDAEALRMAFFASLRDAIPEIAGKMIQLNGEDGTYQLFTLAEVAGSVQ